MAIELLQSFEDVVDASTTYYGETGLGAGDENAPVWRIMKKVTSGGLIKRYFPIGANKKVSGLMEHVWANRATIPYALVDDTTAPTLSSVTIASNNSVTTSAKLADVITLTFTSSEYIKTPTVLIAGRSATVVNVSNNTSWTASITVGSGDADGAVEFSIAFEDRGGYAGTTVTSVTSGSGVTIDKTVPTMLSAVNGSSTQITVTLSELAKASTITKANAGGFTVADLITPATTYAVSAIAPGATNDKVVLTVANVTASVGNGLKITYAAGGNGTVTDIAGNALATDSTGVTIAAV